jgi:hypothetical protein
MSSISAALLNSLRSVERPGDFCAGGIREIFMPAIDVDGVGRIAFPILPFQAKRLCNRQPLMGEARRRWSIAKSAEPGRSIPPRCGSEGVTGRRP